MGMRTSRRTGNQTFHAGMDIGSRDGEGALITAVQGGVIEHILSDSDRRRAFRGYGNGVIVDHGDGTWALYAHLQQSTPGLEPGMRVEAGAPLGRMGRTSNNTFRTMGVPHLHLELRRAKPDGSSPFPGAYQRYNLDPADWISGKGLRFRRRGQLEIDRGSDIDMSRPVWEAVHPFAGLGQKPAAILPGPAPAGGGYAGGAKSKLGVRYDWSTESTYEPVAFDRDVWLGLPPWAWWAAGIGLAGVVVGGVVVLRRRAR